jgi:hypothetical protein
MNRRNAAALQGALSEMHPDAEVDVTPERDGTSARYRGNT